MKIYLFSPETGVYQGEDFADLPMESGRETLRSGATTIAPPPFGRTETPVFLEAEKRWEVRCLPLEGAGKSATEEG